MEKAQKALLGVIELHPDPEALCALSRLATRDSDTREAKASAMTYTSKADQFIKFTSLCLYIWVNRSKHVNLCSMHTHV